MPDETKTVTAAKVRNGHSYVASESNPCRRPTNTEQYHHRCKHRYNFPVNSTVAGGYGSRLIPWGSPSAHFHHNSGVQGHCSGNGNSCRDDQVTDQVRVVVFASFQEFFYNGISAVCFFICVY